MKKDEQLLRLGVLGCGPIAQVAHFDACLKARNTDLYAICDVADDLRSKVAESHHPRKQFSNYEEMLSDPNVDAVLIAVADQYHVSLALKALDAGKPVLVEKPLGVNVEESEALKKRAVETGLTVQVGNNRRFDPGVLFATRFIREELGEMQAIRLWYCDSTLRYAMTDNLQSPVVQSAQAKRPEGNPKADRRRYFMLTHGSHLVDMARNLGGEIASVRARLSTAIDSYCWFVEAAFTSGALGHLELTIPIRGDFEEGFRIYGAGGSVNGRLYLPWFHKSGEVECFSSKDRLYRRPLGEDAYTYKLQLESFADVVMHGATQIGASVDDGLAAMKGMVAIARSVEIGDWVKLCDVTGGV